jgi:adenosine/AMP kinase|uniref:Adenosine monophosphate-protein transferase n=1 Tax=candidate division WOR-3 bacterium TaxID=2052148 RepID=A0A7C3UQD0_UNCW3
MKTEIVKIEKPEEAQIIFGQSHFIKTVEDLYEAIRSSVPDAKFGIAFCESSGPCLVRSEGNDPELVRIAEENALKIGCGHSFLIILKNCYPINVLKAIKDTYEVCSIYAATANPIEVVVAESELGRGVLGVIDGSKPKGIETEKDKEERKSFLRKIGYKL